MVIPLAKASSQALLTRPPLVSKEASFFLLPFDLHVLGLPPAFNLSHDQTLQLKYIEIWIVVVTLLMSAHTNCLVIWLLKNVEAEASVLLMG